MERNRLKELLSPTDYQELIWPLKKGQVAGTIYSLWLDQPCEFSAVKPTRESDREFREAVKKAVEQFLKSLNRQVIESEITQLQQKIVELEKRNKELDDKLNSLSRLLLPFREILEEEKQIEEKLQKEMPELKFEKQDPFALREGGWALPYEQLKELLEEE